MFDSFRREMIALEVIRTLKSRFSDFPEEFENNRNAPFHEAFLNAFSLKLDGLVSSIPVLISLSSWMHGLNTTLGQSFFENVAHILSDGQKKVFKGLKISLRQQTTISAIVADLKNSTFRPSVGREEKIIFRSDPKMNSAIPNLSVDNYVEDDDSIIAIEMKTVKPNSGVAKEEKTTILHAKAAFKNLYPDKEIKYFIGFPFDPLSDTPTGSDKMRFMKYSVDFEKFFEPDEVLLADELWNLLSGGTNTMQQILDIINAIASPEFIDSFNFINNYQNLRTDRRKFITLLEGWKLQRELEFARKYDRISSTVEKSRRMQRVFHLSPFSIEGIYNQSRIEKLLAL